MFYLNGMVCPQTSFLVLLFCGPVNKAALFSPHFLLSTNKKGTLEITLDRLCKPMLAKYFLQQLTIFTQILKVIAKQYRIRGQIRENKETFYVIFCNMSKLPHCWQTLLLLHIFMSLCLKFLYFKV